MILPIRTQGFPELISEFGIQSPLQGPFWGFESTVLPIVDVRGARNLPRSGPVYDGFASAGQLGQPAANSFLANTNDVLFAGAWAIHLSWIWVNVEATNAILNFRRFADGTFAVVQESEPVELMGAGTVGSGSRTLVLQKNSFGEPWGLVLQQAMPTAGSLVHGVMRIRYLGEVSGPAGF